MHGAFAFVVLGAVAHALEFTIPSSPPSNASGKLDAAPVGVSIEFFAFPDYINKLPLTLSCLKALGDVMGSSAPLRIGGTTQDRAVYNASLETAVSYTVESSTDAPEYLTFGDSFMDLASEYNGTVTLGVNRRLNDINNTISAAKVVESKMSNLYAIELGNEPNFFTSSDPIAQGSSWNAAADASSQVSWQSSVSQALNDKKSFIQAGVFFGTGDYNVVNLAAKEQDTDSMDYVRSFCHHYYPQSSSTANLSKLMDHADITSGVAAFKPYIAAAQEQEKDFIMGETNSATQGGGGISPTYGAGLWVMDYIMQATLQGVKQLFFHQGTIDKCPYCWWKDSVNAPFYGAYTVALALSGASSIAQLDSGSDRYAVYAIYDASGRPVRSLLYNSDYYESGTRSAVNITLSGLSGASISAKRLTADVATGTADDGITIGGQTFGNGTCVLQGNEDVEVIAVSGGRASVQVRASEAVVVEL